MGGLRGCGRSLGLARRRSAAYCAYQISATGIARHGEHPMDLKRVEHLMQVADYGSFSKAASVIGIAQPALGRQVRKLEQECGTALLYRNGRGGALTPDGEKLLARLRPLVQQMEAAVLEIRADRQSPCGQVTVGLTPTLCGMLGLPLICALREKYPAIQLNVLSGYSGYVHEWLIGARVDIAVLHDARRSRHLLVEAVAELELSVISSPQSLSPAALAQTTMACHRLEGLPLVLPTKNHGLRRTVDYAASQAGVALTVAFEIDSLELMRDIVARGLAHTILARSAVQGGLISRSLHARTLTDPAVSTKLMLATASNRAMTRAVKAVELTLRAIVDEMARSPPHAGTLKVAAAARHASGA